MPRARLPSAILNTGQSRSQLERMNVWLVPTSRSGAVDVGFVGDSNRQRHASYVFDFDISRLAILLAGEALTHADVSLGTLLRTLKATADQSLIILRTS